jgi:hypothetical protein
MALAHWGVSRDLFREGTAKETHDPKAGDAAMRKVGMVVRRPIGSSGPFEERRDAEQTLLRRLGAKAPATNKGTPVRRPKPKRKPAKAKKRR